MAWRGLIGPISKRGGAMEYCQEILSLSPSLLLKEEADSPTTTPPTDDDVADL